MPKLDGPPMKSSKVDSPHAEIDKIDEIVAQYESVRAWGQNVSLSQLCGDCPDLVEKVARRIAALESVDKLLEELEATPIPADHTPCDAETEGLRTHDPPSTLGRYELKELVGQGGFGQVWLGWDTDLLRHVAVKIPRLHRLSAVVQGKLFLEEARKAAKLCHPGIVPVFDYGRDGHYYYIVSQWVDGPSLANRIKDGRLPFDESARIVAEVAEALHHAHLRDLVHRDIKPGNILLDSQGKAYVTDFGIAVTEKELLEDSGTIIGTLGYMAPEQAAGQSRRVTPRTDIYSLGVVFYQLLTGRLPSRWEQPTKLRRQEFEVRTKPPRTIDDNIPAELERVCLKAIAKDPRQRYSSGAEVIEDLHHWQAEQAGSIDTLANPPPLPPPVPPPRIEQNGRVDPPATNWIIETKRSYSNRINRSLAHRRKRSSRRATHLRLAVVATILLVLVLATMFHFLDSSDSPKSTPGRHTSEHTGMRHEPAPEAPTTFENDSPPPTVRLPRAVTPIPIEPASPLTDTRSEPYSSPPSMAPQQSVSTATIDTGTAPPMIVAPVDAATARSHQAAWAEYQDMPVQVTNSIGVKLLLIPPGEFLRGSHASDEVASTSEKPPHLVRITRSFYLGMYPVTQAQWEQVMGTNPSHFRGADRPVDNVSWEDSQDFIRRLNNLVAERGRVYRLPTEAEWEYACRAGTTSRYYFGDDDSLLGEYAWYSDNSGRQTHPVGQKSPNPWGLYDMHGNVSEWCSDWYSEYYTTRSPIDDPTGPRTGKHRVLRGGS